MKKDGCYLSITGDDVMVNRVVTSGELARDAHEMKELAEDACSSFQATVKTSSFSSKGSSTMAEADKGMTRSSNRKLNTYSSSRKSIKSHTEIDVEVERESLTMHATQNLPLSESTSRINRKKNSSSSGKKRRSSSAASSASSIGNKDKQSLMNLMRDFGTCSLLILSGLIVIFAHDTVTSMSDAILALFAVILLYITIYPKMKESGYILLQTLPKHIDVNELKKSFLLEFSESVLSIHDMHIWCLTSDSIILTCHVTLKSSARKSYTRLSRSMEKFFVKEGISLATIQPEFMSDQDSNASSSNRSSFTCLYKCSNSKDSCLEFKCCHENESECLDAAGLLMQLEHRNNINDEDRSSIPLLQECHGSDDHSHETHHSHSRA
jgi:hypothetical protein